MFKMNLVVNNSYRLGFSASLVCIMQNIFTTTTQQSALEQPEMLYEHAVHKK